MRCSGICAAIACARNRRFARHFKSALPSALLVKRGAWIFR
jgi:hypothetical protein